MSTTASVGKAPRVDGTSGNDVIVGQDNLQNTIYAGYGDDTVYGGSQDDLLVGEAGNDTIYGGAGNDTLYGGGGNDTLYGGSGDDKLYGDAGNDYMAGGTGNDLYAVDSPGDQVVENPNEGVDTVQASISYALPANVENLTLTGTADLNGTGNELDNVITGNSGNNVLSGGAGNDELHGGDGNDTLNGGTGNNKLYGDGGNDLLIYNATDGHGYTNLIDGGAGVDTLQVQLTSAQFTAAVRHELINFTAFAADPANTGKSFHFTALGDLTVSNVEALQILVDGKQVPVNVAPVIDTAHTASALTAAHNATVAGQFAATDANGDALAYSVATGPQHGTVTFTDANGHYTYAAGDYVGADSFTLQVSDGFGGLAAQTVTVTDTNAAPVVTASSTTSSLTVAHNAAVTGQIAATDANGDTLSYSVAHGPQHGAVTFTDANGHYTYTAANYVGADSFSVQVSDGHGGLATQVVSVSDTNAAPVVTGAATTASIAVAHQHTASGQIAATDADGDALSYSVATGPQHGTVTFTDANGHYTYAAGDYVGADSFTLKVDDGFGGVVTQVVGVTDTNAAPILATAATTASIAVAHQHAVAGQITATDADGDALSYSLAQGPQHGTVTFTDANGHYTYAAGDYVGADSFTVQVSDGHGGLATQVVGVTDTNAAPILATAATTASLAVAHQHAVAGQIAATDADGDSLSYSVTAGPQHGTVTFTDANGHYTYAAGNYVGADSFTLAVSDGHGGLITQVVGVTDTNAAPVIDVAHTTAAFTDVQGQTVAGQIAATDADGDTLSYSVTTGPQHGTLAFTDANGHYTYTAGTWAGTDSFTLAVSDGHGGLATETVNVGVYGTLDASASTTALNINLGTDTGTGVDVSRLAYAQNVTGGAGNDLIYGDNNDNILSGGDGKDELHGAGGNDAIIGGAGDDKLFGEDGNDTIFGGDGNDMLNGGAGNDVMYGDAGNDTLYGGGGNDTLYGGDGNDNMYGDGGADTMYGGAGNDVYQIDNVGDLVIENAGEGTDTVQVFGINYTLTANVENMQLMGATNINGTGNTLANTIVGNTGNNVINGGGGADILTGGGGSDTFVWTKADVTSAPGLDHITDFGATSRLDFSAVFNNTHPADLAPILHVADTTAGTLISADNGAGAFVDVVVLDNVHHVTLDDLVHAHQIVV